MKRTLIGATGLVLCVLVSQAVAASSGKDIVDASGIKGGLVVHVGCGTGELTAALHVNDSFVVHGLDTDPENVAKARRRIRAQGLAGRVSGDTFDGRRLPYVDNLINLLVADDLGGVRMEEVMRVLAPRGVAVVGGETTVKPWPAAIDEWTHYLHGPDNNAVAEDRVVGPPRHMQWLSGPTWTRDHHADKGTYPTIRAVVSSRGRLYYMVDEAGTSDMRVPSKWFLAARDAFSGVLLWKRPLAFETFERRLEQVWRTIVADGDRVYAPLGPEEPLAALDSATGAVIDRYPLTAGLKEMVKDGNRLFVISRENRIVALEAEAGNRLWQWAPAEGDALVPLTLAASDGRVFIKTEMGVRCLSGADGKMLWQVPLENSQKRIRLRWPREKLLVSDGVVLCSYGGKDPTVLDRDRFQYLGSHPRVHEYGGKLAALSAEDGRLLWHTDYLPGLESTPGEIYISDGVAWLGPDFSQPRDLRTGAVRMTRPVLERLWTTGHHYRCYPGKATCRYILTAKRGVEMIDLAGENHSRNNWVRGTCRVGVTPCNGLLYAPPHSCGCYMEAKLYGFWALAAERKSKPTGQGTEQTERLQTGPAYGRIDIPQSATGETGDWWTYRGDAARSGSTSTSVPADVVPLWSTDVGAPLSAPTVAGGRVLVAQVDAHTVHALDAETGEPQWRFTAGARVDSPPTIYVGRISNPSSSTDGLEIRPTKSDGLTIRPTGVCIFGSRDGWVYCLRASDGELVWRFLAAPEQASAVAYEQVESLWPVHGSVLVYNGTAYVAAGRSSYLDGGIILYGLDPETGEIRSTAHLRSEHTGALEPPPEERRIEMEAKISQNNTDYKTFLAPDRSDAFSMRGALTDVLTAEGDSIFMRHLRFDGRLVEQAQKRAHLFSTSSLLDGSEHNRSYWVLGTGDFSRTPVAYPWIVKKSLAVPYGLMLAFDERTVWGVHRVAAKAGKSGYVLFAAPRPNPDDADSLLPDFEKRSAKKKTAGPSWATPLPMRPRAMIRAGDVLVIGGERPDSEGGGMLHIVSAHTGQTLSQLPLPSPPTWDALAASRGRLYVSLNNGQVLCLAARTPIAKILSK